MNDSHALFMESTGEKREVVSTHMSMVIIYFDVATALVNHVTDDIPTGFARRSSLKRLVHMLIESDICIHKVVIPGLMRRAAAHQIQFDRSVLYPAKKHWRKPAALLHSWRDMRNMAAAHYDSDIARQVELLNAIDEDTVIGVAGHFLLYCNQVIGSMTSLVHSISANAPKTFGLSQLPE